MGLFWDLMQQSQISHHADRTASVEQRLEQAEAEIGRMGALIRDLVATLETHLGTDLNQDGRVG
jgi:hypothetical protein